MRIGISGLFLKPTKVGGAEFVLFGLAVGLAQIEDVEVFLFLPAPVANWLSDTCDEIPDLKPIAQKVKTIPIKLRGNRFVSEIIDLPKYVKELQLEGLLFPNYFTPLPRFYKIPTVTTIHDLNYWHFPELFDWKKRLWQNLTHRLTLRFTSYTVTDTEHVRNDVAQVYGLANAPTRLAKLKAINIPILWERFTIATAPNPIPDRPFLLSVANHYKHKNLATLLQAFAKLPRSLDQYALVLVGQLPDSLVGMRRDRCDDIPALVNELGLGDRVYVTGYISNTELAWYYRHADLFVFPSVFEGFGLPPVEAIGLGLPTLTTRCTTLPEVTLELAEYIQDAYNAEEWRDRIVQILADRDRFIPSAQVQQKFKTTYDPVALCRRYLSLIAGKGT
ncbi:glycosyl transferase group 1 [Thalassoporum mexicanum PCC 7367]|uniref:glycosyltransferase family 4 protein n=1 Tax=Thalassoporum mexicanum TaxID=3457544 RepID=UPI00029FC7F6|nr:glycosyltransferase family 1 protein [Pseudanabaena sp. PCC 7367]AFY71051.1 glycosyl transferase group 1 [Pseudanabaena sp. PCC 7367]